MIVIIKHMYIYALILSEVTVTVIVVIASVSLFFSLILSPHLPHCFIHVHFVNLLFMINLLILQLITVRREKTMFLIVSIDWQRGLNVSFVTCMINYVSNTMTAVSFIYLMECLWLSFSIIEL